MIRKLKAHLIANAGILIEDGDLKIMIDGLHGASDHDFSVVSDDVLKKMSKKDPLLSDVDYLLFTHEHSDHFSKTLTLDYLQKNMVKGIFLPKNTILEDKDLQRIIRQKGMAIEILDFPLSEKHCFCLSETVKLTVFKTKHLREAGNCTDNYPYLLEIEGTKLLFMGDADYQKGYYKAILKDIKLDWVFVNPLFINKKAGRTLIENELNTKKICVYHLPFAGDDHLQFRKMIQKDLIRYKESLPETMVFENELDTIDLR